MEKNTVSETLTLKEKRHYLRVITATVALLLAFVGIIIWFFSEIKKAEMTTDQKVAISQQSVGIFVALTVISFLIYLICLFFWQKEINADVEEKAFHRMEVIQVLLSNFNAAYEIDLNSGKFEPLIAEDAIKEFPGADAFLTGTIDKALQKYAEKYIAEDYREGFLEVSSPEYIRNTLKDQKYFTFTYIEENEGKQIYGQIKVSKIGDDLNKVVYGFANVDDEKQTEIRQRTMLMNALNKAERANLAKSSFLSNMSHDIRTPMNAVLGFTTLARVHLNEPQKVDEYLSKVMSSGKHLLSLINDVLDMRRIESGKIKLEEAPCSLNDILDETEDIFIEQAQEKGIHFVVNRNALIDDMVFCDKLRMNQILLNLVSNAIRFTGEGGTVELRVRQRAESRRGTGSYAFSVRDTGKGMTEQEMEHIWDPYEMESSQQSQDENSSGLGMSITKSLVDLMNGEITVESEPGQGTTFKLLLTFRQSEREKRISPGEPVRSPKPARGFQDEEEALGLKPETDEAIESVKGKRIYENVVAKKEEQKEESETTFSLQEQLELAKAIGRGRRVLIVDDNDLNLEIANEIFKEAEFDVDLAEDAGIALQKIKLAPAGTYFAVFMDVEMPVMNGYEATQAIRELEDEEKARTTVIAMTANAFEEDRKRAEEAGMNAHISKPVSITKLIETLSRFI